MKRLIHLPVATFIAVVLATAALGQESAGGGAPEAVAEPPEAVDTITVRGQRIGKLLGELRLKIELAEEAVFARFNEINSTDDFDIHCRPDTRYASRMVVRVCQSNSWEEQTGKIGTVVARSFQGQSNVGLAQLHAQEQLRMQRLLAEELRQLTAEDGQLQDAMVDLTKAQLALVQVLGNKTLLRELSAVDLQYDAERIFEIVMGNDPFRHRLTQQTFTVANVFGQIKRLDVQCAEGGQRIDYAIGVDWTVPNSWSSCVLRVDAKKGTTFRLYEF